MLRRRLMCRLFGHQPVTGDLYNNIPPPWDSVIGKVTECKRCFVELERTYDR